MPDTTGIDVDALRHIEDRAMTVGSAFVVPIEEHLGEGLREAAFRATSRNAFRSTDIVVELSKAKTFRSLASMNEGAVEELDRLVGVLGIRKDAEHIKAMLSNNGFAGKDWIRYFGLNIRRGHLAKGRRVAPRSLRKADCLEGVWSLRPLGFDLKTREMLLDLCPVCKRSLGWRHTFGPSFCDLCPSADDAFRGGVDLRDFPQPIADVEDDEAIELLANLVDPAAPRRRIALDPDLGSCNDSEIFQLIVEIGNRLDENPAGWGRAIQTRSLERAGRAVLDWPRGLENLVEGVGNGRGFEGLHLDPKLPHKVRRILADRTQRRLHGRLTAKISCGAEVSVPRPAPLKNCLAELRRLVASDKHVSRVEAALVLLRRSRNARRISDRLGLPLPYLIDLFEAGLLPELVPVFDGILSTQSNAGASVVDQLLSIPSSPALKDEGITIWAMSFASTILNGRQWGVILSAIVAKRLSAVRRINCNGLVHQFHCSLEELSNYSLMAKSSAVNGVPLTQNEIAKTIGKSPIVVRHLVENGMLPRNATGSALEHFRRQWMFSSEARDLFLLRGRGDVGNIRTFLSSSNIPNASTETVTLWSRAEVNELLGAIQSPVG
ncbi:hypothetical protein [Rhizobium leguminosarum]|uniref:hypothetical protein n=1 Tax=Rhizobium leguminosarum TaxID=384 RepID=UPI001C979AD1|nr:hypothetical protein [Rhizobium leguminosarum]MBY5422342.1 hypothetical protein [Rhizobium leguminosarum]